MKKIINSIFALVTYLSIVPFAHAAPATNSACPPDGAFSNLCKISGNNFGPMIGAIVQAIFILAILAALIYLVWGGFKWLISGGDKSAVGSAREHIIAALIGLVIIFLSYFILNILLTLFFGDKVQLNNLIVPTVPVI